MQGAALDRTYCPCRGGDQSKKKNGHVQNRFSCNSRSDPPASSRRMLVMSGLEMVFANAGSTGRNQVTSDCKQQDAEISTGRKTTHRPSPLNVSQILHLPTCSPINSHAEVHLTATVAPQNSMHICAPWRPSGDSPSHWQCLNAFSIWSFGRRCLRTVTKLLACLQCQQQGKTRSEHDHNKRSPHSG